MPEGSSLGKLKPVLYSESSIDNSVVKLGKRFYAIAADVPLILSIIGQTYDHVRLF